MKFHRVLSAIACLFLIYSTAWAEDSTSVNTILSQAGELIRSYQEYSDGEHQVIVIDLDAYMVCENLTDSVVCTLDRVFRELSAAGYEFEFIGECQFNFTASEILASSPPYGAE